MIKSAVLRFMVFLLAATPLLGVFAGQAHAATSRVAVIKSLTGTVQVKKAGGSKQFRAFAKMSLNEGDVLTTSANSGAELQFANGTSEDDRMTVSANTTLSFSKLSDRKGTRTKVSMFNGTAWVDVKSISTKNDEFTLETPTAVMGVRGTHLLASVDPRSLITMVTVMAGVVHTEPTGKGEAKDVKPGDNALVTKDENDNGEVTIATVDLDSLIGQADPSIIQAIIQSAAEIVKENMDKREEYFAGLDTLELDAKKSNLDNLIGAFGKSAVEKGKLKQDQLTQLINRINEEFDIEIELDKARLFLTAQAQLAQEMLKQKQEEARRAAEARMKKEEAERKKNEELNKKLEEKKKQQEEAIKKQEEAKKKKAQEEYEKQLSELDKERFKKDLEQLTKGSSPSPSTNAGSGSGSSSGGSSQTTTYKVTYHANGGTGQVPAVSVYEPGTLVPVADGLLTRSGFLFSGWNTKADGSGTHYNKGETFRIVSDVDLYAYWTPAQVYENPLHSLEIIYYTSPPYASDPPNAQRLEIPLDSDSFSTALPYIDSLSYSTENNLRAVVQTTVPHAAVNVTSNGIPIVAPMMSDSESTPITFEIPLYRKSNEVVFEVTPPDSTLAPQKFSLKLTREEMPPGLNWTATNGVQFNSVDGKVLAAEVPKGTSPFTFDFSVKFGEGFSTPYVATYDYDVEISDPVVTGDVATYTITVPANDYYHFFMYSHTAGPTYGYDFIVNRGMPEPEWTAISSPLILHTENGLNIPATWNETGKVLEAEIGADENMLVLNPGWEWADDNDVIKSVFDVNHRYAEQEPDCRYDSEVEGFCLYLQPGDNLFEIHVTDQSGLYSHTYLLNVHQGDLPTGVVSWSAQYTPGEGSPKEVEWQSLGSSDSFEEPVYFISVPESDDVKLYVNVDDQVIQTARLWEEPYGGSEPPDEIPDDSGSFVYQSGSDFYLTQRYNELELKLTDTEGSYHYAILFIVAEDQPYPELNVESIEDGHGNILNPIFGGPISRVVYPDEPVDSVIFSIDSWQDVQVFKGTNELWECDGESLTYCVSGISPGETLDLTIWVDNPYHLGDPYTLTIYNPASPPTPLPVSLNLQNIGVSVTDSVYSLEYSDYQVTAQFNGVWDETKTITLNPELPSGSSADAKILGIYDDHGDKILRDGTGYHVDLLNDTRRTIYIVIRDGIYVRSVMVFLDLVFTSS
ncbi:InlB B-repeat-containing protein [Cohnella caldifontis]|uniref:InlB B-repeat-containing protein n=1 Tax=Cohnella caldifontis TaxID=3027471 RepID=UPI0023EB61DB|nr:InlB B-repeat-containing protein [Cohnella sp. YIM B05605]